MGADSTYVGVGGRHFAPLMKKPGRTLQAGPGFHGLSPGAAIAPPTIRNATLVKPIVQDNIPRKTEFTFEEAVDVWLRRWAGQFIHEIAAAYVINWGRVIDVLNETTHVGSKEVAARRFGQTA
jgi:hypothetical protein